MESAVRNSKGGVLATYPGHVQEVEAPVSEEVVGSILPDLELGVEGDLAHISTSDMPMSDAAHLSNIMLLGEMSVLKVRL